MGKYQYLFIVNINQSLENDFEELLNKNNISYYTKIENTKGKGENSDPHLGTAIWPEMNNTYLLGIKEKDKNLVEKQLLEFKSSVGREGCNWFLAKLEGSS